MVKVYIDGQEGTTGLKILERFKGRNDIELLKIDEDKRKDADERKKLINSSDFTFLCLPDAAAREAVAMAGDKVRIIDASTAHRTNPDWAYGFPELGEDFRSKIANNARTAVPGCYASGFISMIYPLVKLGIMPADYPVTCHAVSGYSGAGKKAIAVYESENRPVEFESPRQYFTYSQSSPFTKTAISRFRYSLFFMRSSWLQSSRNLFVAIVVSFFAVNMKSLERQSNL